MTRAELNNPVYSNLVYNMAERMDPEKVHDRAINALSWLQSHPLALEIFKRAMGVQRYSSERLRVEVGGIVFENPLIVAAGMDKNGRVVDSLYQLGFSSIVAGTVTRQPQDGDKRPRIHRLNGDSLINNVAFANEGADKVLRNLSRYYKRCYPLGLSVGINTWVEPKKTPQYFADVVGKLYEKFDFLEINVTSPNTAVNEELQKESELRAIIEAVRESMFRFDRVKPIFLKASPDASTTKIDTMIRVALDNKLTIVATNTSAQTAKELGFEKGGASGRVIRERSLKMLQHLHELVQDRIDLIGVGGVTDLESAIEKMQAGAKALQIYTGFVLQSGGPAFASRLNQQLDEWMSANAKS